MEFVLETIKRDFSPKNAFVIRINDDTFTAAAEMDPRVLTKFREADFVGAFEMMFEPGEAKRFMDLRLADGEQLPTDAYGSILNAYVNHSQGISAGESSASVKPSKTTAKR